MTQIQHVHMTVFAVLAILLGTYLTLSRRPNSKLPKIPFGLFIVFFLLRISVPIFRYTDLQPTADALDVAATIVACMAVIRVIVYLVVDHFIRQKRGIQIASITRDFGLAIMYVIIAMIVLKHRTNVNLGSLLTTSAILTAVIGFAMQDTLGNLFSGLALQLEHPYQIGDWIGFENQVGKVVGITWKSTKILTGNEELIFVPNNTISKSTLKNFSRPTLRHQAFIEVGASYDNPPHLVKGSLMAVMNDHPRVVMTPPPDVRVLRYDPSSIVYRAIFATEDFGTEERTKAELLNSIWYKFKREGIKIPYPVQEQIEVDSERLIERDRIEKDRETKEITKSLDSLDLFASLSRDARASLAKSMTALHFAPGETIVSQGDKPGPMYIIKEGDCSVLVSHSGETPVEVATLKPSQFFGEMSLLTGDLRTATVKAKGNVTCYEIEKDDIRDVFEKNPDVMKHVSEALIKRQTELDKHKELTEESTRIAAEKQSQLISRIRSFLGL